MIKNLLKKIHFIVYLKRIFRAYFQITINYYNDSIRYIKYSSSISFDNDKSKLEGRICVFYHALEKGLSLPNPKKGFGEKKAYELMGFILKYNSISNSDRTLISTAIGVLKKYFEFNDKYIDNKLQQYYHNMFLPNITVSPSPYAGISKAFKSTLNFDDYSEFVRSRKSIRDFNNTSIKREVIEKCIDLARFTPSVCNRQPWKAYIYQGKEDVQKALSTQHGNRGFCDDLDSLILVTCEIGKFWHALERNQLYIDGGMFSMSIVNALHAKGLGSCCLNLSLTTSQERQLKSTLNICQSEVPIMMITVSEYNDGAKVASSERLPLNMFLGN